MFFYNFIKNFYTFMVGHRKQLSEYLSENVDNVRSSFWYKKDVCVGFFLSITIKVFLRIRVS